MALEPLSPEWWLDRLYKRLRTQRDEYEFYDAYYRGDHPLPWLSPQARDEFRRLVRMTRSNVLGLVVDSTAERLQVEGFRLGEDTADADTWRIWQANDLDNDSDQGFLEALIGGRSYVMVAPNPDAPATPLVTLEDSTQVILEYEPGSNRRRRAAALKVWDDDWTGELHATLQLPGLIYKFRAVKPRGSGSTTSPEWLEREVRGEQPNGQRRNPLGVVSVFELPNNPRLRAGGVSELADVTDIQDRINKTLFDRMQTQEFGVDPQKWAKGFPATDDDGNPQTIEFGRNRMVTSDVAETAFGNFAVAPLDPYSVAKREDVKDIASRTRTPAQYLLGEMSNVNGETLKASESGLVAKVRQRQRTFGEGIEAAMRLARRVAGLPDVGDAGMETMWRDPQYRTPAEAADAAVKLRQERIISHRQALIDLGYPAGAVQRILDEVAAEAEDPLVERISRELVAGSDAA